MSMSRVGTILTAVAFGAATAGTAHAANQGDLGATSQGDLTITLTIDSLVQISDLQDIDLGTFDGTSDLTGSDNLCVYSNSGGFTITATGTGGGAFELAGGGTTVPFAVEWANTSGAVTGTALTSGSTKASNSPTFSGADCGGGTNTTVLVNVSQTDLGAAPAADYSGLLILQVAPE